MNWPLPTLPPTATNGCQPLTSGENETWMLSTTAALNDGYFTPSYFYDDNNTTIASSLTVQKVGMTSLQHVSMKQASTWKYVMISVEFRPE